MEVEDQAHFLLHCTSLRTPWVTLWAKIFNTNPIYLLWQYCKTSIRTALHRTHVKGIHDMCTGSLFYTNHMHLQNIYVFSNHIIYILSMQLDNFLRPLLYVHRYMLALSSMWLCITNLQHFPMAMYYSSFLTLYWPIGKFFVCPWSVRRYWPHLIPWNLEKASQVKQSDELLCQWQFVTNAIFDCQTARLPRRNNWQSKQTV